MFPPALGARDLGARRRRPGSSDPARPAPDEASVLRRRRLLLLETVSRGEPAAAVVPDDVACDERVDGDARRQPLTGLPGTGSCPGTRSWPETLRETPRRRGPFPACPLVPRGGRRVGGVADRPERDERSAPVSGPAGTGRPPAPEWGPGYATPSGARAARSGAPGPRSSAASLPKRAGN